MDLRHSENLTAAVRGVLSSPGAAYERLVVPPTGGAGEPGVRRQLEALRADDLTNPPAPAGERRDALLAGLWLRHDFLDESHAISQGIASATGSLWHAIMHRREGDFSNARYWYARCRNHPVLVEVGARAAQLAPDLFTGGPWDPNAFVDLVGSVYRQPGTPRHAAAVRVQQAEWAALFDHCLSETTGRRQAPGP